MGGPCICDYQAQLPNEQAIIIYKETMTEIIHVIKEK